MPDQARLEILCAPLDQGVRNVGGREGAREGPGALVEALDDAGRLPERVAVRRLALANEADALEVDLDRVSEAVARALEAGRRPLVLGGDHGLTYATARGASRALGAVGVCYLDVHFDMRDHRPVHTSGSSLRRLVEEGIVAADRVAPIGIEPPEPGAEGSDVARLAAWADEAGVSWASLEEAKREGPQAVARERMREGAWVASLDVDAIDASAAPGVSAPGEDRFTVAEASGFLDASVDRAQVLEVAEFAPRLDEGSRTLETLVELVGDAIERAVGVEPS